MRPVDRLTHTHTHTHTHTTKRRISWAGAEKATNQATFFYFAAAALSCVSNTHTHTHTQPPPPTKLPPQGEVEAAQRYILRAWKILAALFSRLSLFYLGPLCMCRHGDGACVCVWGGDFNCPPPSLRSTEGHLSLRRTAYAR